MASSIDLSILDESVMAGEDIVARIRVGGDEPSGLRLELPFSLPVPVDLPPTFVAKRNLQEYKLVVSAARRMRSDFEAKHRVYIASAAAE
jgi:hypothetical protein